MKFLYAAVKPHGHSALEYQDPAISEIEMDAHASNIHARGNDHRAFNHVENAFLYLTHGSTETPE